MDKYEIQKLEDRNKKIIETFLNLANSKYPNAIDLIAIAGSFCSGNFYDKSDLDLLIVSDNEDVQELARCFIMDGVGFDIYIVKWEHLNNMARYNDPYVTKLKHIDIVYTKDDSIINKYRACQYKLDNSMEDTDSIDSKLSRYFALSLKDTDKINSLDNIFDAYIYLGNYINNIEYIVFMLNHEYIKGSTIDIPSEIERLSILPNNFISNYRSLLEVRDISSLKELINNINKSIEEYVIPVELDEEVEETDKMEVSIDVFRGTYEELYSNYYNKLYRAANINDRYLSFKTMYMAQEFFDEFYKAYNIKHIDLIDKYNPFDLYSNAMLFSSVLAEWKTIYDKLGLEVLEINDISELYKEHDKINM